MPVKGSILSNPVLKADDLQIGDGNRITKRGNGSNKPNRNSSRRPDSGFDLFDIIDAPLPVSGEGDFLMVAAEVFETALESNLKVSDNKNFAIQAIPKEVAQLPYDILVLIHRGLNSTAMLYPFIIADSMEREYTHPVYMNQSSREYVVTPDSIYDANVYGKIKRVVGKTLKGYTFNHVGFLLIPRNFDYENNVYVKRLLNNAMNAIDTVIKNKVITADHIAKVGLLTRIRFAKDQVTTLHGRVARSDLSIMLEATKLKKNRRSHRDTATSEDFVDINRGIIRCDAFVDLVFAKQRGGLFNSKTETTSKYIPRLVITNLEQKQRSNTMGLTLVALATTYMLQTNKNWALALKRPRGKAVVNNWHDIGAIAYEINTSENPEEHDYSRKIATDDPSFDNKELKKLIGKTFNNNLLISLDVEMGGPQIWLQTHFTRAAYTDDDHPESTEIVKRANRYILDVANQITNNRFSKLSGGKEMNVVYSGYEKIHLGTYEDENNELRDIRDICYRAILNNCQNGDLSHIITWANSFDRYSSTEGARIALREDMIRRMTSGRVNFEAMGKRITFNPMFLQLLCMALMGEGVNMVPIISDGFNTDEDRYFANYARYGNDIDPIKIMMIKQRGIDLDNPTNLSMEDVMFLKMLNINPFENHFEMLMSRFGNKSNRYEHDRGYSCF